VTSALFAYVIRKGLAAQRAPALQDLAKLVGATGVARTDIEREGTVYVGGELWSAASEVKIPAGTDVVVLDRHGLVLKVAAAAQPKPAEGARPMHS
jgi:membrane-bound serine protease (ClpP class)